MKIQESEQKSPSSWPFSGPGKSQIEITGVDSQLRGCCSQSKAVAALGMLGK
jgi:hypothetical protein